MPHQVSRRDFLYVSGALMAWAYRPRFASAGAGRDPRFISIILRGGLDGIAAVAPLGDPDYERVRQGFVLPRDGAGSGFALDGFFALHPAMPKLAALYKKGEAIFVHAAATAYRGRSHFDAQDILESTLGGSFSDKSGWMNRLMQHLRPGDAVSQRNGLVIGAETPLIMSGAAPVVSLMPAGFRAPLDDTRQRLLDLYRHQAPELAARFEAGLDLDGFLGGDAGRRDMAENQAMGVGGQPQQAAKSFHAAGAAAGKLLARDDGPRIGAMSFLGWDTHINQGPNNGRLANLLGALDEAIDGLRTELGAAWQTAVVVVLTEFGRTVAMNGSAGTDHGTATIALIAGGAVNGPRLIADWPGLSSRALFEGRDLRPTLDLRAVLKGVLMQHLDVPMAALDAKIFPGSEAIKPLSGLVRV